MKLITVTFVLLTSLTSYGTDNFKEGYLAGLETCSAEELISCKVEFKDAIHPSHPVEIIEKVAEGYSRGEALKSLIEICKKSAFEYKCLEAVRNGLSTCKNL